MPPSGPREVLRVAPGREAGADQRLRHAGVGVELAGAGDVRRADLEHRGEDPVALDRLLHRRCRLRRVVGVVLGDELDRVAVDTALGLVDLVEVDLHPLADHAERGQRAGLRADEGDLDRLAFGQLLGRLGRAVVGRDLEGLAGGLGALGALCRLRRLRGGRRCRPRRPSVAGRSGRVAPAAAVVSAAGRVGRVDGVRCGAAGVVIVVVAARSGDQRQADRRGQHASDPAWIYSSWMVPPCGWWTGVDVSDGRCSSSGRLDLGSATAGSRDAGSRGTISTNFERSRRRPYTMPPGMKKMISTRMTP